MESLSSQFESYNNLKTRTKHKFICCWIILAKKMNPGKRINSLVVFLVQLQSFLSELAVLVANRSKRSFYSRSFDKNFGITNVFDFYELLLQLQLNVIWRSDSRISNDKNIGLFQPFIPNWRISSIQSIHNADNP